jgi:hypothetical protein
MKPKIRTIVMGVALAAASSAASAQTSDLAFLGRGGAPVAFCCQSYDGNNEVGQECSPVPVTIGATSCTNYYFECDGPFLCGAASLVDPTATVTALKGTPVLPDCECGTFVPTPS